MLLEPRSRSSETQKKYNNRTLQEATFSREDIMSNDGKKRMMRPVGIEERRAIRCGRTRIFRLHLSPSHSHFFLVFVFVFRPLSFAWPTDAAGKGSRCKNRAPYAHSAMSGSIGSSGGAARRSARNGPLIKSTSDRVWLVYVTEFNASLCREQPRRMTRYFRACMHIRGPFTAKPTGLTKSDVSAR